MIENIHNAFGPEEWEQRLAELWASIDDHGEGEFVKKMELLVSELPAEHPVALFEHGGSLDSTGHSDLAIERYQEALERGLDGPRRRRAVIQLASSLRNIGQAEESVRMLEAEMQAGADELDDAVIAFLALALVETGKELEAVSLALGALSRHLPSYQRSVARYPRLVNQEVIKLNRVGRSGATTNVGMP